MNEWSNIRQVSPLSLRSTGTVLLFSSSFSVYYASLVRRLHNTLQAVLKRVTTRQIQTRRAIPSNTKLLWWRAYIISSLSLKYYVFLRATVYGVCCGLLYVFYRCARSMTLSSWGNWSWRWSTDIQCCSRTWMNTSTPSSTTYWRRTSKVHRWFICIRVDW